MKIALLSAYLAECEGLPLADEEISWLLWRPGRRFKRRRLPKDEEILVLIKNRRGCFKDWKINTLKVELSRARLWFRGPTSQRWFDENPCSIAPADLPV